MIEELERTLGAKMLVDDVDKDERCITFRLNTDAIDDKQTVIMPSGGKFENYRKSGSPVFWHHGLDVRRGLDPIGKNLMIRSYGAKRPEVRTRNQFLTDDFSQQRYEWYRDGILSGISLRFRQPNEGDYGPPTHDEIRARPELEPLRDVWRETQGRRGFVLRSWDLAEQSLTPLPSNPEATAIPDIRSILECCRSGLWLPDDVKAQLEARMSDSLGGMQGGGGTVKGGVVGENTGATSEDESEVLVGIEADDEDSAKRFIDEEDGDFVVKSEKGKPLGKYKSHAAAEHRLKQVEYFKHKEERSIEPDPLAIEINGRLIRTAGDVETARAYLAVLETETDTKKTPEYLAFLSRSRHEAFEQRMKRMINEYVEFRRYGALGSQ